MRKLTMLAIVAAAMAFPPTSAFAAVEVEETATNVMCDNTVASYCVTEWTADLATWTLHTGFGQVDYVCDVSIPVHVQSDGSTSSESVSITDEAGGTGDCTGLFPCEEPWTSQLSEVSGSEVLDASICLDDGLVRCEGTLHSPALTDTGTGYSVELQDIAVEGDFGCEFSGHFAADGIRVHHP